MKIPKLPIPEEVLQTALVTDLATDLQTAPSVTRSGNKPHNHRTLGELLNDLRGMVFRCRHDKQWTMEYVSAGAFRLTGYHPKELMNNARISYDQMIADEDRERVRESVKRAILEKASYDLIYSITTAANERKLIWERAKGIYSQSSDLLGLEGFMTDITPYQDYLGSNTLTAPRFGLQCVSEAFFADRLAHRQQRYQQHLVQQVKQQPEQDYAVVCIHFDNLQRYTSRFSVTDNQLVNQAVIKRLNHLMSPADTLGYRLIQDIEIILDDCKQNTLQSLMEQWQTLFRHPVRIAHSDIFLTLSIGAVSASYIADTPTLCLSELRRYANQAMMQVHEVGGNSQILYVANNTYK